MPNAVAIIDPDQLIAQIADGAFLRDLALQTGIDKRRLSEQLRNHPDYDAAKQSAIECQLDEAQEAIKDAPEMTDIARARERFRSAAWRAEREYPSRWGNKVEHSGPGGEPLPAAVQITFVLPKA